MGFYRVYGYDRLGKCVQNFVIANDHQEAIEKSWWIPDNNKKAYLNTKPSKNGLIKAKAVEEYYNIFIKYYRPSSLIVSDFNRKRIRGGLEKNIDFIINLINHGFDVRGGYLATSIRGFHDKFIFYKKIKK